MTCASGIAAAGVRGASGGDAVVSRARRKPFAALGLTLLAIIIFGLGEVAARSLQYDRAAIGAGQMFRIITAHFTHWSGDHLLWDVAMFASLGIACERRSRGRFLVTIGAAAVAICSAIHVMVPAMQTYRGLSGVDSALFALLAVGLLREAMEQRRQSAMLLPLVFLLGFVVKLFIETLTGQAIFVNAATFAPVPLAHFVGALVGAAAALLKTPAPRSPPP